VTEHGEPQPEGEEELVAFLERDQLTADTAIPLRRAQLSRRAERGLWALRVAVALLALQDQRLAKRLDAFRARQAAAVKAAKLPALS